MLVVTKLFAFQKIVMSCGAKCVEVLGGALVARLQAVMGGLIALVGAVMVVAGVVVLALDCQVGKMILCLVIQC